MQSLPEPDNRIYIGVGGSGKSTLARAQAARFPRVIVCDPNGETDNAAWCDVVTSNRAELVRLVASSARTWRICWRFPPLAEPGDEYTWAARVAWARGDCAIMLDEVENFMAGNRLLPWGRQLWNQGRHRRVRCLALTRSCYSLDRTMTRNMQRAAIFATQEPSDLRWLELFLRDPAALEAIAGLKKHQALDWRQGRGWCVKMSPFA